MAQTDKPDDYFAVLNRWNWRSWFFSGLMALVLNLILFLLLPQLMDKNPPRTNLGELVSEVHIIRIKDQEVRPQPKKSKPPESPPEKSLKRVAASLAKAPEVRLRLPFVLNPRLPAVTADLQLPPLPAYLPQDISAPDNIFSLGQLDAPLTTMNRMPPIYPLRAKRRGIEGWVKISFVVTESGRVADIAVLEAEPPGFFEESVKRCVRAWRFKPGCVDGRPVKTRVETKIRFNLDQER